MAGNRRTRKRREAAGAGDEQWRDWASMTEPLLQSILGFITTLPDFSAFRAVCKSWRSVAIPNRENLSRQSPFLLFHHFGRHTKLNKPTKSFFDISERCCYASPLPFGLRRGRVIGYSHGCIIAIPSCPYRRPYRRIVLCDIVTGKITRLPGAGSYPYRILLSAPPSSPTCIAVVLATMDPEILYCRIGNRHWTEFCLWRYPIEEVWDVFFFQGRLHFLTNYGAIGVVDLAPQGEVTFLQASKPNAKISISANDPPRTFLAESGGDLLLVGLGMFNDQFNLEGYKIWRWDFEGGGGLVEVTSLGERTLFIVYDGPVASISASAGSGVRGNCIYHIPYHMCGSNSGWTVYSLDDRTLSVVRPGSLGFATDDVSMPPVWILPSLC